MDLIEFEELLVYRQATTTEIYGKRGRRTKGKDSHDAPIRAAAEPLGK